MDLVIVLGAEELRDAVSDIGAGCLTQRQCPQGPPLPPSDHPASWQHIIDRSLVVSWTARSTARQLPRQCWY